MVDKELNLHVQLANRECNTHPCNLDPVKPHFFVVKQGLTRVYMIFLMFAQNVIVFTC